MQLSASLTGEILGSLRCPACHAPLEPDSDRLRCTGAVQHHFPVVRGVPVLLNPSSGLFSVETIVEEAGARLSSAPQWRTLLKRYLPHISRNTKAKANYRKFAELLLQDSPEVKPRILIVGGGVIGAGLAEIIDSSSFEFVETDVTFDARTTLICDAHDVPFADGTFDGLIIQGVLSLLLDPARCASEVHRVLKDGGLVYAETAFMQQVAGGRYDFTRFTHLGHRRLFREFQEIDSGVACGPGMALAWSYHYFLLSFVRSRLARSVLSVFARLTGFWLKYFDGFLVDRPGAFDAGSSHYFLGRRSDHALSDQDLIKLYRGCVDYAI